MKCQMKDCDGEYRVIASYYVKRIKKRHRLCDKCNHEDYTIEISSREYDRMRKLIIELKESIRKYMGN